VHHSGGDGNFFLKLAVCEPEERTYLVLQL
jgi:hypothetical protein